LVTASFSARDRPQSRAVDLLTFEETRRATSDRAGRESRPANGECRTTIVSD
jgi:hypothetical protein